MKVKVSHVTKVVYRYPQPAGFVSVKDFVFARNNGRKCLLIRFSNDTSFRIDRLEYTVTQLDDKGEVIGKTKQIKSGLSLEYGCIFTTPDGVIVDENCSDIRVDMENICSGKIKYRFENGELNAEYMRDLTTIVEGKPKDNTEEPYERLYVGEKKLFSVKKALLTAIIGLVFLTAAAVLLYYKWFYSR